MSVRPHVCLFACFIQFSFRIALPLFPMNTVLTLVLVMASLYSMAPPASRHLPAQLFSPPLSCLCRPLYRTINPIPLSKEDGNIALSPEHVRKYVPSHQQSTLVACLQKTPILTLVAQEKRRQRQRPHKRGILHACTAQRRISRCVCTTGVIGSNGWLGSFGCYRLGLSVWSAS